MVAQTKVKTEASAEPSGRLVPENPDLRDNAEFTGGYTRRTILIEVSKLVFLERQLLKDSCHTREIPAQEPYKMQ